MASTIILSDNGASSGSAGLKQTAGNDGVLILQTTTSGGTATNAVYIDTSQKVGIGTTSPLGVLDVASSSNPAVRIRNTSTGGAGIWFANSTSGTTTSDGSNVGIDSSQQLNLWNYENTATLFATNNIERARITSSGNFQFTTADAGIVFNKTGALNNQVLNDYEYGTWTPSIGAVGGSNFTMSEQNGSYVKVGKMVTVIGILSWTSKGSASSSAPIYIKNLPFLSNSDGINTRTVGVYGIMPATNTNWYNIWLYGGGNDTNIQISGKNSLTGGSVDMLVSDISSSTTTRFSITYYTD